jgi:hypothetical protein
VDDADVSGAQVADGMPKSVAWYERLSYAAIILTIASAPLNWGTIGKYWHKNPVAYPLVLATVFLVQACWIWLVARKRQNWARWTSLVVVILGLLQAVIDIEQRFRLDAVAAVAYYAIDLMIAGAVGLLFLPDANPWFRPRPQTSNS